MHSSLDGWLWFRPRQVRPGQALARSYYRECINRPLSRWRKIRSVKCSSRHIFLLQDCTWIWLLQQERSLQKMWGNVTRFSYLWILNLIYSFNMLRERQQIWGVFIWRRRCTEVATLPASAGNAKMPGILEMDKTCLPYPLQGLEFSSTRTAYALFAKPDKI